MSDLFVSHVEEDQELAQNLADVLQEENYSAWLYENDVLPGVSYLVQTGEAIHDCKAFLLLVTPYSLGSNQVGVEVIRAFEEGKPIFALRNGVSHSDFQRRQPDWRQAIGSSATIPIETASVRQTAERVLAGLQRLGIEPSGNAVVEKKVVRPGPQEMTKCDILISAYRGLEDVTASLCTSLKKRGFTVLTPFDLPAGETNFANLVDARLDAANILLVVGEKPDDFRRSWVEYEYRAFHMLRASGRKTGGAICSIMIGAGMSPAELPLPLATYQAIQYDLGNPERSSDELVARLNLEDRVK